MRHLPITIKPDSELRKFPDWRYSLLKFEETKLSTLFRRVSSSKLEKVAGNYLLRSIEKEAALQYRVNFAFKDDYQEVVNLLNNEDRTLLFKLFKRHLNESKIPKVHFLNPAMLTRGVQDLKISKKVRILDQPLVDLLLHLSGVQYDDDIERALNFKTNEKLSEIFKSLGYTIYLGKTDKEIGAQWKVRPRTIEKLRLYFFDFSMLPKEPIANFNYLKQFFVNKVDKDFSFEFYRLINELGELGLKAVTNFTKLAPDERLRIEEYLGASLFENTFKLKFTIKSREDAKNYNAAINGLASLVIKNEEVKVLSAKHRNLEAQTKRLNQTIEMQVGDNTLDETGADLHKMLKEFSLRDGTLPVTKTLEEIVLPMA